MVTEMRLCDHDGNVGVLQHELETVTGEGRIQGDISAPCFENAQEAHESIHRAFHIETHRKICADPKFPERARGAIRSSVQFLVADGLVATGDSGCMGSPLNLRLKERMDTGDRMRWLVPRQLNVPSLLGGQQ